MEIKVRALDGVEQKSTAQVEEELLLKHEAKLEDDKVAEVVDDVVSEITEDQVLSHIRNKYNKEFSSMDDIFAEREAPEELPEDVASYFNYKKETGRGINDYVRLQRDFNDDNPDTLLRDYLKVTETALDNDDIESLMEEYSYDEDLDEESHIKKIKVAKKKAIAKAKNYFLEQQEKYKQPLESRQDAISDGEKEEYEVYKQYLSKAATQQDESKRKSDWFTKKTDEVFNSDFKGFDFNIGDNQLTFSPGNTEEVKKSQLSAMNFVNKHLDEDGLMKDAKGYHKALAAAMNPDKFAQFFYEQGKANATEESMRNIKNINMSTRNSPSAMVKSGTQVKSLNTDSGRGLKIRSVKRK
jgi:hypothetical protein